MHAHKERMSGSGMAQAKETIEISDKWWDTLNAMPFVSCKLTFLVVNTLWSDLIVIWFLVYVQKTKEELFIFWNRVPSRLWKSAKGKRFLWRGLIRITREMLSNPSKRSLKWKWNLNQPCKILAKFSIQTTKVSRLWSNNLLRLGQLRAAELPQGLWIRTNQWQFQQRLMKSCPRVVISPSLRISQTKWFAEGDPSPKLVRLTDYFFL